MPPAARTYGLATAALVCGLVGLFTFWLFGIVPLLGAIFGLISARAVKRSNGTLIGLGKARAGWITGLIGVAAASVFMWASVTGRLDTDSDTSNNDIFVVDDRSVEFADVGDCMAEFPEAEVVYELEFVSCDVAHGVEVYVVGDLNPNGTRDYPGDDVSAQEVKAACTAGFQPYVGRTYEESVYEVYYLYPRALRWNPDGGYVCFLGEVGKTIVGSAFQSDR